MVYLIFFFAATSTLASVIPSNLHLDLGMTGREYQSLLMTRDDIEGNHELDPILKMGNRLYRWLDLINKNRPQEERLSLSSAENQPAYPIDFPKVSSPKIILKNFRKLSEDLPALMAKEVLGTGELSVSPPVSDQDFVYWGRKIDDLYGGASRWILQEPMLWGYAARRKTDIRGFYYLSHLPDIENHLSEWSKVSPDLKSKITNGLMGLCLNSGEGESQCSAQFDSTLKSEGSPRSFYQTYLASGETRWNELFLITNKRTDINWQASSQDLLTTPFQNPESESVLKFLKDNIEDEWRWIDWKLQLNFISGGWDTTHIQFVPGATPHVNGLAGSTITMDANQPLSEYHVRWTIRHEFGHTLGFPDCYVEFYDTKNQEMISYQVDTSNLMCSRRGKLQEKHFEELKRVYLKN